MKARAERERAAPESPLVRADWELRLPRGRSAVLGERPAIVGVLNCTPDSFSDGGRFAAPAEAVDAGLRMVADGADWLDVGGESTRPGAGPVPPEVQLARILPVIRGLRRGTDVPISVDTTSPTVASEAIEAGADIVNDVGGLRDPGWRDVLGDPDVPVIVVHMQGTPRDMQASPTYPIGVVPEVLAFFVERLLTLADWGVDASRTIVDPGIGFGKRLQDNFVLVRNIDMFACLGRPVLIGTSRKSFLRKTLEARAPTPPAMEGRAPVPPSMEDLDLATVAVNAFALERGCHLLRVHDVSRAACLVSVFLAARGLAAAPRGKAV